MFVAFSVLFPIPLWIALSTYAILNASLIASAVYKYVFDDLPLIQIMLTILSTYDDPL